MKKITKQFKDATKHISLSEDEKGLMRERLVAYMEYKPIRKAISVNKSSLNIFSFFRLHHFSGAFVIAAVVMSSSFGVSFAADDALPGDLLYGVKVNINEEIKTVFLKSNESRIAWERERAERRLVEASQLAAEGRLDSKSQKKVSKLFAEHTDAMVEQVLAYEEVDPVLAAEASSAFEDSLDTHEAVLARLIVETEDEPDEGARELVEQVRTVAMEVEKIREDAEEKIDLVSEEETLTPEETDEETSDAEVTTEENTDVKDKTDSANMRVRAAYGAKKRAEDLLVEARALYMKLEQESELRMQAEAQVSFGEKEMEKGAVALEDHNLGQAYGFYRKASASFQKVVQLLEVAHLFSIEIYPDKELDNEEELAEEGVAVTSVEVVETEHALEITEESVNVLRTGVKENIEKIRTQLLTQEGYDMSDVEDANARVKDAGAQVLRGEIAMILEDYESADILFAQALELTERTLTTLEKEAERDNVNNVYVPPVVEEDEVAQESLVLTHTYSEGVHIFSGVIEVLGPCHALEGLAFATETNPEQIMLEFTLLEQENESTCIEVGTSKAFKISVVADEDAELVAVKLDGVAVEWSILQEIEEDEEVEEGVVPEAVPEEAYQQESEELAEESVE